MKKTIRLGLFIGVGTASFSALLLQFLPLNYPVVVGLLYLYAAVGALTAYLVRKNHINDENLLSKENLNNKWITIHTKFGEKFRGFLDTVDGDFLKIKHAFPLEDEFRLSDMLLHHREVRRVEIERK